MISRACQLIACCAGGQDDINPHFLRTSKATAQPRYTRRRQQAAITWYTAALQQRYNSSDTTAPALEALAFVAATAVLVCDTFAIINSRLRRNEADSFGNPIPSFKFQANFDSSIQAYAH